MSPDVNGTQYFLLSIIVTMPKKDDPLYLFVGTLTLHYHQRYAGHEYISNQHNIV